MIIHAIRRLLLLIFTLFVVTVIIFLLMYLLPGDPARARLHENAPEEAAKHVREQLGLDRPLYQQYLVFLIGNEGLYKLENALVGGQTQPPSAGNVTYGILRGDLGTSLITKNKVAYELKRRFAATAELILAAMFVAVLVGISVGVIASACHNTVIDRISLGVSLVGVSMPIYWLGLILLFLFAATFHWIPAGTRLSSDISITRITGVNLIDSLLTLNWRGFFDTVRHIIFPAVVLATFPMSVLARMTRSAMHEVLSKDTLRSTKGVKYVKLVAQHALRNEWIPIVTVIGLQLGGLLSGAVLTESVFAWPGVGRWVYESIQFGDYPVVQGVTLVIALLFALIGLVLGCLTPSSIRGPWISRTAMSDFPPVSLLSGHEPQEKFKTTPQLILSRVCMNMRVRTGLAVICFLALIAALVPAATTNNTMVDLEPGIPLQAPSSLHWFGTDEQGRDVFGRVTHGTATSLHVGLVSVGSAIVIGSLIGLVAGFLGGAHNALTMQILDGLLAIPSTLLAVGIVATRGPGLGNTMLAISVIQIPLYARIVCASALSPNNLDSIPPWRSLDTHRLRLLVNQVIPKTLVPLLVQGLFGMGAAILEAAALGFLGWGVQPPVPEWGAMLSNGYQYMAMGAWWVLLFPGLAIVITVSSFNLLGDGLRDVLVPRALQGSARSQKY